MNHTSTHTDEIVYFLQKYIKINTAHPQPDYAGVCALFKAQAEKDGFLYKEIILPSGRPFIVISYRGSDDSLPSLLLNHHMDVVPASNIHEWVSDPFAGEIHDGVIVGRGAQDTKSTGVAHYFAVKELKQMGYTPLRTVHILIAPDEEIGGGTGTKEFVESEHFTSLHAGFIIDEAIPSGNRNSMKIKISERKPLQITITVKGHLVHGATLRCFNPIHELVAILNEIRTYHDSQQEKSSDIPDGLLTSMNITSLQAGIFNEGHVSFNIVPDCASATVDIRVSPQVSTASVQKRIEDLISHYSNSSYTVHASVSEDATVQSEQSFLYSMLERVVQQNGYRAEPLYFEGATDIRYYRARGLDGVGCTPFYAANNIHGTNESLSLDDLCSGKNIMKEFIYSFCFDVAEVKR
jgi:N-acyl-L-amino-acid amidohydrolase